MPESELISQQPQIGFPHDFERKSELRLWNPKTASGSVSYLDGAESYLEEVISGAKDLRWSSGELAQKSQGKLHDYHLSPVRAGLLLGFRIHRHHSVLDIGAGCGMLTRFLGESAGRVVAIEGSAERAKVAAMRCRDLQNVDVVVGNIEELQVGERFDIVTMVGVLEYSARYITAEHPYKSLLETARRHLSDNGVLILAIENKLGLKYFAGCREDHLAAHYEGIEGYPGGATVQTFGRKELGALVRSAGFTHTKFLAAHPDFKYPQAIVALDGAPVIDDEPYLYQWLGMTNVSDGSGYPAYQFFREHFVYKQLEANGILGDMANSYVVLAGNSQESLDELFNPQSQLYKFNLYRNRAFMTRVALAKEDDGPKVIWESLFPEQAPAEGPLRLLAQEEVRAYEKGQTLMDELYSALAVTAYDPDPRVAEILGRWHAYLKDHCDSDGMLPGNYWDCTPWNIIVTRDGALLKYYDREFEHRDKLPLKYILFRGMFYGQRWAQANLEAVYYKTKLSDRSFSVFLNYMLGLIGERIEPAELDRFLEMEWYCAKQISTRGNLELEDYKKYWLSVPDETSATRTVTWLENRLADTTERLYQFANTMADINRSWFWQLRLGYVKIRQWLRL